MPLKKEREYKMKARIKQQPKMAAYLELNQKFGYGYQGRLVLGMGGEVTESVLDKEPYELADAYAGMYGALEDIKKREGYKYKSHELIHITDEAIQANKSRDFTTAKLAADIAEGKGKISVPYGEDYRKEMIDGKEEVLFTGRGTMLTVFFMWHDDKIEKAKEGLKRYCEYLAMQRYGGTATEIFAELEGKDKDNGVSWIKATYGKYVKNDAELIAYVLPKL